MADNEFNFYNSENDGYRGGFGDYADPSPAPVPGPAGPGPESPGKRPGRFTKRAIALLLACVVVGGAAGAGGAAAYQQFAKPDTVVYQGERPTVDVDTVANSNGGQPMTPEQLYAANLASCVGITVSTTSVNIFGQTTTSAASGSGFVLTQDGYIVTNYHVIEDAVDDSSVSIEVSFADGAQYTATLVGGEQDNDVAVLKIDATGLQPVTLGDSEQLVVGETVYTIGNPLGELTYSLSNGLVSALDRLITTSSTNQTTGQTETTTLNVLQTNCDINPGNSGGPLFDSYGNVVGIVTAKYTQTSSGVSAEGLGFALPINDVKEIINDLIEHGYVTGKPYLGIQVQDVSDEAQRYGISAGAAVLYVADGSCAQEAGLQVNDIIIAIDDTAIDSSSALTAALSSNYKAGDTVTLTVIRNQQQVQLSVTLDEQNEQTEAANQIQEQSSQDQQNNSQSGGSYYNNWPFGGFFW
ncbi:trypsin-like peptidase domain-containing protein [Pseudoflavonifractor sp. An184]|uniref:S1C family serine protease n=1 Tax=Pseudoflavonifractor sp. An184 TaxID=1965576 RepID=UPI000B364B56|nr:trypsin-like peptidase domain-containing protein [Pseudoflavonifractor sp. An184]OUP51969.1 serine protease HtrA [Pseudoflavonifractor sp. An184]